jgi:hypothetical protein
MTGGEVSDVSVHDRWRGCEVIKDMHDPDMIARALWLSSCCLFADLKSVDHQEMVIGGSQLLLSIFSYHC